MQRVSPETPTKQRTLTTRPSRNWRGWPAGERGLRHPGPQTRYQRPWAPFGGAALPGTARNRTANATGSSRSKPATTARPSARSCCWPSTTRVPAGERSASRGGNRRGADAGYRTFTTLRSSLSDCEPRSVTRVARWRSCARLSASLSISTGSAKATRSQVPGGRPIMK